MVSVHLRSHYDSHYGGTSEWRRLGAIAKSRNIACGLGPLLVQPRPRILEIGCGEGCVLERLTTDLRWAAEGLEISSSGASAAASRGLTVHVFDGRNVPFPTTPSM
jgi:hypothetical protein